MVLYIPSRSLFGPVQQGIQSAPHILTNCHLMTREKEETEKLVGHEVENCISHYITISYIHLHVLPCFSSVRKYILHQQTELPYINRKPAMDIARKIESVTHFFGS